VYLCIFSMKLNKVYESKLFLNILSLRLIRNCLQIFLPLTIKNVQNTSPTLCAEHRCMLLLKIIIILIVSHNDIYGALWSSWLRDIARVHPVHLMNAD